MPRVCAAVRPHCRGRREPKRRGALLPLLLSLALLVAAAGAPSAQERERLAVLDFDVLGAGPQQGAVLANQLRAELLKTGRFTMVNRAELDKILSELALQQQICTEKECAVQVGKLLGVRRIVTGTVTKVTDTLWQVSTALTDVETSEVLRQEVVNHAGDFGSLFLSGMASVAKTLAATEEEVLAGVTRLAPESIAPAVHDVLRGVRTRVLVFSPDSARLYYAVGEQLLRWDVQAREAVGQPVEVPGGAVTALAVNRKGDRIVAGTESGAVALIDANNGRVLGSADEHGDPVTALAVSPADNFYASGSDDEEVHVYHLRTGAHAFELADVGEEVTTVRFGADGKTLVVASRDRMVRLYDVNLQKELRAFKESAKRLLFAELSRDGAYLAIAAKAVDIDLRRNRRLDTELVKIRDMKTGEELLSFEAHDKDITGLAFFPDTRYLATGGADKQVKLWELQAAATIAALPLPGRVLALALSPNGKWLAAADETEQITLWAVTR